MLCYTHNICSMIRTHDYIPLLTMSIILRVTQDKSDTTNRLTNKLTTKSQRIDSKMAYMWTDCESTTKAMKPFVYKSFTVELCWLV